MSRVRPSRRTRHLLPGVLMTALAASGAALWSLGAGSAAAGSGASTLAAAPAADPLEPPRAQPVQDMRAVVDRASRSRRADLAAQQQQAAARAKAAAATAARAAAQAAAKAAADAKAEAEAERKARNARACPAPTASFIDSWGYGRSGGRHHKGTDMMAPTGAPIYAVRAGVVKTSRGGNGGLSIYLTDASGDRYYYAHNSVNLVRSGERVEAGELIARVGSSGNATSGAPHLHFEWQPGGGRAVPSYRFLREIC